MTDPNRRRSAWKFAGKWHAERAMGWISEETTDEALEQVFAGCVCPPKRDLYPLIRAEIAAWDDDSFPPRA